MKFQCECESLSTLFVPVLNLKMENGKLDGEVEYFQCVSCWRRYDMEGNLYVDIKTVN